MSIEVERSLDLFFKLTNIYIQGPTNVMDVVKEALKYFDKDPAAKALKSYMKNGGQLDFSICLPQHAKEMSERLKDEGVIFLETSSMANGGVRMFVFADADKERVNKVLKEFRAEHAINGITDKSTFLAYAEGNAIKISNLDFVDAKLIEEHSAKRGIQIMIEEPEKGKFSILYAQKDEKVMNRIKADTAIELSGLAGQALKKQIEYENENYMKIMRDASAWKYNRPFHIVDLAGNHMKADKYGVTYEGKEGRITIERNESDFNERLNELMIKMRGPVRLTEKEYEKFQNTMNQKEFLIHADRNNGRPIYTKEEYSAIQEMIQKKELYELKLAMLEPDECKYEICIENEDMRMASFEELNDLNEQETKSKSDELNPVLLKEIVGKLHTYVEENIDSEVLNNDLEEKILDGNAELDRYKDDLTWDIMRDRNNNLIPDEYENLQE